VKARRVRRTAIAIGRATRRAYQEPNSLPSRSLVNNSAEPTRRQRCEKATRCKARMAFFFRRPRPWCQEKPPACGPSRGQLYAAPGELGQRVKQAEMRLSYLAAGRQGWPRVSEMPPFEARIKYGGIFERRLDPLLRVIGSKAPAGSLLNVPVQSYSPLRPPITEFQRTGRAVAGWGWRRSKSPSGIT
jgi:hypothetical protein